MRLIIIFLLLFQADKDIVSISPNGMYSIRIRSNTMSDIRNKYVVTLKDIGKNDSLEIANFTVRDWPRPNFHWDHDSQYLIIEQRSDNMEKNLIKVIDIRTKKPLTALNGFIGYLDDSNQQFDPLNNLIFYFDTSNFKSGQVPPLWELNLRTLEKRKLLDFNVKYNIELPGIERADGKRTLTIKWYDFEEKYKYQKEIAY